VIARNQLRFGDRYRGVRKRLFGQVPARGRTERPIESQLDDFAPVPAQSYSDPRARSENTPHVRPDHERSRAGQKP